MSHRNQRLRGRATLSMDFWQSVTKRLSLRNIGVELTTHDDAKAPRLGKEYRRFSHVSESARTIPILTWEWDLVPQPNFAMVAWPTHLRVHLGVRMFLNDRLHYQQQFHMPQANCATLHTKLGEWSRVNLVDAPTRITLATLAECWEALILPQLHLLQKTNN